MKAEQIQQTHFITDQNENKWKVIEASDIEELLTKN